MPLKWRPALETQPVRCEKSSNNLARSVNHNGYPVGVISWIDILYAVLNKTRLPCLPLSTLYDRGLLPDNVLFEGGAGETIRRRRLFGSILFEASTFVG